MAARGWKLLRIKSGTYGCWIEFVSTGPGVVDVIEVYASWEDIPMVRMAGDFEVWIRNEARIERQAREIQQGLFD